MRKAGDICVCTETFSFTEDVMGQHNFGMYHVAQLKLSFFVWLLFVSVFFANTFAVKHTHLTSFFYFRTLYNYDLLYTVETW